MPDQSTWLQPGHTLTVTALSNVAGTLTRQANMPGGGDDLSETAMPAGTSKTVGPFSIATRWKYPAGFTAAISKAEYAPLVGGQVEFGTNVPDTTGVVRYFDDFQRAAFDETNENWILNSGSDDLAVDPAIVAAAGGTAFLDAGDGDGTVAVDGSQLVWAIPVQAGYGGLFCEARIKLKDITGCSVNVGFTDVTTLEEPFSIATATITSNATDAVCFVFDDGATTKEWYMCGVDSDTDATGNAATGTAPVNDTYQVLRIEVDADGEGAEFFVDGTSVGRLTASVVEPDTDLYFTVIIVGDGSNAAAVGLTVDYVDIGHNRA